MRILSKDWNIEFMARRRIAVAVSLLLIVVSLASLGMRGLSFGIDFTGGTLVEVGYAEAPELTGVRESLRQRGFEEAVVQYFGTARDVLIRLAPRPEASSAELSTQVLDALRDGPQGGGVEMRRIEFVGPQVGEELAEKGGLAMLGALFGILVYVWLRFEKRFSVGAIAALVHDVIITLGLFSLLQLEFDLPVLAALLAVIGYSLNDTIVVFDRVRENFRKVRKGTPVEVVNLSINQMLSRTLVTSLTTLLVLFALFLLGGEIIHNFALALIVGIIVGTYSSIYVANVVVLALGVSKADLIPVPKEGEELEGRP